MISAQSARRLPGSRVAASATTRRMWEIAIEVEQITDEEEAEVHGLESLDLLRINNLGRDGCTEEKRGIPFPAERL